MNRRQSPRLARKRLMMERQNMIEQLSNNNAATTVTGVRLGHAESSNESDENASIDSLSTVEDLLEDDPLIMAVEDATAVVQEPIVIWLSSSSSDEPHKKEIDVAKYMTDREMTPLQERINAITMIPNPLYCLYFILSGCWVSQSLVQEYREASLDFDARGCFAASAWWLPVSMPPATILAVLYGVAIHAPFSFLYHWKYALACSPTERTSHWSRRMDHSMIHVASMFFAYASSSSWDYTCVNILFNADCAYRQFKPKVRPRRNQIRVGMSILAYTIPLLGNNGGVLLFSRLWFVMLVAGWFFVKYPVGGWSHAIFHLILCGLPYFMMQVATMTSLESEEMHYAAQCTAFAERNSMAL